MAAPPPTPPAPPPAAPLRLILDAAASSVPGGLRFRRPSHCSLAAEGQGLARLRRVSDYVPALCDNASCRGRVVVVGWHTVEGSTAGGAQLAALQLEEDLHHARARALRGLPANSVLANSTCRRVTAPVTQFG